MQLNLNNQYVGKAIFRQYRDERITTQGLLLTDFNAQYEFKIAKQEISLQFLLNNIFNKNM